MTPDAVVGSAAGVIVAVVGLVGVYWQTHKIRQQVQSPNGTTTAAAVYEARKATIEIREALAEVREAQFAGWQRAAADTARAEVDRVRLEEKVDAIGARQELHDRIANARFQVLFDHAGIDDPGGR